MTEQTKPVQDETPDAPATEKTTPPDARVEDGKPAKPKAKAEDKKSDKPKAKAEEKKAPVEEPKPSRTAPPLPEGARYIWGTGRRKAAIARVRIRPGEGKILINKRELAEYFTHLKDQEVVVAPLEALGMLRSYDVWVNLKGGGWTGQSGAVSLGLARALAKHMPDIERDLRHKGLLTRDARAKERKKPGQPGARKRFQFSKR